MASEMTAMAQRRGAAGAACAVAKTGGSAWQQSASIAGGSAHQTAGIRGGVKRRIRNEAIVVKILAGEAVAGVMKAGWREEMKSANESNAGGQLSAD